MERVLQIAALAVFVLMGAVAHPAGATEDKVINIPPNDAEMGAAIAKARKGLPQFWAKHAKPGAGESNFTLKVQISDNGQVEHFWLSNIERKGNSLYGTVNNEPRLVGTVKLGQRISFKEDMISDWMYMRNGKLVGNETMRPLLKRMPKAQADQYQAMYETP